MGDPGKENSFWGRPEQSPVNDRPVNIISPTNPGTDVAAQVSAAMAALAQALQVGAARCCPQMPLLHPQRPVAAAALVAAQLQLPLQASQPLPRPATSPTCLPLPRPPCRRTRRT